MRNDLGLDVVLSDLYKTRLIAESKKKTDKVDALILADMLRGGYIAEATFRGAGRRTSGKLVRYRRMLVKSRTREKNPIHGILLQMSADPGAAPFSSAWLAQVRRLGDYRIGGLLSSIERYDDLIRQADVRLARMVKESPEAMLLKSIPGVGNYSAPGDLLDDRRCRKAQQPPEPHLVRGACPVGQKLCGRGTPRAHNQAGRHADEGDPDRVCPDPHSARAKLVRHEGIRQDWTKEGQRKGRSGRGRQDAARRLPDPQGEKRIP